MKILCEIGPRATGKIAYKQPTNKYIGHMNDSEHESFNFVQFTLLTYLYVFNSVSRWLFYSYNILLYHRGLSFFNIFTSTEPLATPVHVFYNHFDFFVEN